MDYKKPYKLTYDQNTKVIESQFLEKLNSGMKKGFSFYNSYKELIEELNIELKDLKNKYFEKDYKEVLKEFEFSYRIYNETHLLNTLNDQTLNKFNNENIKSKLNYIEIVKKLALYESIKDALKKINDNSHLYDIMYQANDYKNFIFEFIDGEILESDIFKSEYARLYPAAKIYKLEVAPISYPGDFMNVLLKPEEVSKLEEIIKVKNNDISEIQYNISKFSEDEKILLMSLCFSKNKLPKTELLKTLRLSQIKDFTFLIKCDSNNTTYNKFTKGIDYYEDVEIKRKLIDGLLINIEGYGLKKLKELLLSIKRMS